MNMIYIIAMALNLLVLFVCWMEYKRAEAWKETASFLNKQLDSSYLAFTEQRCLMKKTTVENELLKAENEELKHREGRIKDFCREASASTQNRQRVPWEAD